MAKKYIELDSDKRELLDREMSSLASVMGQDEYDSFFYSVKSTEGFGLCDTCKYFQIVKSEFRIRRAYCNTVEPLLLLFSADPIIECSEYQEKGAMSLYDMRQVAYIIELPKRKIGFIEEEDGKDKSKTDNH